MKTTTYTVPGCKGQRKSPRAYTHAIVGRIDWDATLQSNLRWNASHNVGNLAYYLQQAARKAGDDQYPEDSTLRGKYEVTQKEVDTAAAWLTQYGRTPEAVKAATIAECHAKNAAARAKPGADDLIVLQWSQSASNATKALGTWAKRDYRDVQVRATKAGK